MIRSDKFNEKMVKNRSNSYKTMQCESDSCEIAKLYICRLAGTALDPNIYIYIYIYLCLLDLHMAPSAPVKRKIVLILSTVDLKALLEAPLSIIGVFAA